MEQSPSWEADSHVTSEESRIFFGASIFITM
jgi:hypothetical protein